MCSVTRRWATWSHGWPNSSIRPSGRRATRSAAASLRAPTRSSSKIGSRAAACTGHRRTSTRCWPCAPSSVPASAPTPAHAAARQAAPSAPETGASAPTLTSPSPPVPKTIVDGRPTTAHSWKRRFLPHRPAPPAANCRAPAALRRSAPRSHPARSRGASYSARSKEMSSSMTVPGPTGSRSGDSRSSLTNESRSAQAFRSSSLKNSTVSSSPAQRR